MRRISVLGAALFFSLLLGIGVKVDGSYPAPTVKVASGDLAAYIESFVKDIPRAYSKDYDVPTFSERSTMAAAYDAIEAGNLSEAASLVDPLEYDVIQYEDTVTGRTLVVLSERSTEASSGEKIWPHAWGMYVFSPHARSDVTVEVTHPVFDKHSEEFGVDVFLKANAEDLFIAGAHRYANCEGWKPCHSLDPNAAADVAHAPDSVFEGIHEAAVESPTNVFQPHGFDSANHPGEDCGEVFVSAGKEPPSPLAKEVHDTLQKAGFTARLFGGQDGTNCKGLGATTNVQGIWTNQIGADFVHAEMSESVRRDPDDPQYDPIRKSLLTGTIANALLRPTVTSMRPAPGTNTRDSTPPIGATVRDAHTDLTKTNIQLYVDGRPIFTFTYDQATDRLSYTPERNLSLGGHKVRVQATDAAGNRTTKQWSFKVAR
jgi:hypothetical protein